MKPNHIHAALARAKLDQQLNAVLVLTAPAEAGQGTAMPNADELVRVRLQAAHTALDQFEEAIRGG